jgi:hypothetical protein
MQPAPPGPGRRCLGARLGARSGRSSGARTSGSPARSSVDKDQRGPGTRRTRSRECVRLRARSRRGMRRSPLPRATSPRSGVLTRPPDGGHRPVPLALATRIAAASRAPVLPRSSSPRLQPVRRRRVAPSPH